MQKIVYKTFFIYFFVIATLLAILGPRLGIISQNLAGTIVMAILMAGILSFLTVRLDKTAPLVSRRFVSTAETERTETENTPNKTELKTILSGMVEGVIVVGKDEKIVILNPIVCEMLNLRSKDAVGRSYWEVIRHDEINSLLKESLLKKEAFRKELTILFPEESYFSMQISPILEESGDLLGSVAVFHDISELRKLEKMRSEFVANVSHELKTPLTSIRGFVETLKEGALNDEKAAQKFLGIIQTHTQKLEDLVYDLLNLSSLESKDFQMKFQTVVVKDLINEVVNLYKVQLEKKYQTLAIELADNLPSVRVDPEKIEQAFSNLLDNAVKFTPPHGKITISAYERDGCLRVDIRDTGPGIADEHLPRIFERFYRADKSRSRELGGTGLGLAIVKHIVLAHNGKVTVQSVLGEGSVFSVYLPTTSM